MGGITGYFGAAGVPEVGESDLVRAVDSLRSRGPDEHGAWRGSSDIGLGYTRRLIASARGDAREPILSPDGRWAMVIDGGIFNAADLRDQLAPKGHRFVGSGEHEVILAAFREWGIDDAVKRFNGTFAMALWDTSSGSLTLIRDRMGVKPLYYGWNGRTLWFGSELESLRAYRHWQARIDDAALADFLHYSYIVEPYCIYQQVQKLAPGQLLTLTRGGQPVGRRYWAVREDFRNTESTIDDERRADELESVMADACRIRAGSGASVGVFLSGGVDSSVVAALLARDAPELRTFTIGFDDPRYNEADHAEQVARHLGTRHTTQIVSETEALTVVTRWGELYDEPFGDCSGIPTLLGSVLAARQVEVILAADGADELFGTYQSYDATFHRMHSPQSRSMGGRAARLVAGVLPWERVDDAMAARAFARDPERSFGRKLTQHLRYLRETRPLSTPGRMYEHSQTSSSWHGAELARLLGRQPAPTRSNCDSFPGSAEEQMRLWDLENYTSACILTKVDRATTAAGIEAREPLLDPRVVAAALSLPDRLRGGALGAKHLLRKVLYRHVPRELIERPKMGFAPPIGRWMSGALRPLLDSHLDHRRITEQGLLDPVVVRQVRARFDAGDVRSVQRVWLLLAFQLWHARWMEAASNDGVPSGYAAKTRRIEVLA